MYFIFFRCFSYGSSTNFFEHGISKINSCIIPSGQMVEQANRPPMANIKRIIKNIIFELSYLFSL